jgi:hypothetical protein
MNQFATTERRINRVWSSAADDVLDEAHASLLDGRRHLHEAIDVARSTLGER